MPHRNIILLVDDNPDFVELAKRAFSQANIINPVIVAEDGVQALDYLFCSGAWTERDPADIPVVVLLDMKLPRVGGLDVLRRMREDPRTRLIPVVILTTSSEDRDITEAYLLGCNSYIRKPVDFTKLSHALQQAGLYWLALNEPPVLEKR